MAGQPEHICQLAEAGRGWRRLEAALSLIQRWRGVHITWRTHHSAMAPSSWCRPSMLDTCAGKWASLKSGAWAVCAPSVLMLAVWQAVAQAAVTEWQSQTARRQRRAPPRAEVWGGNEVMLDLMLAGWG